MFDKKKFTEISKHFKNILRTNIPQRVPLEYALKGERSSLNEDEGRERWDHQQKT